MTYEQILEADLYFLPVVIKTANFCIFLSVLDSSGERSGYAELNYIFFHIFIKCNVESNKHKQNLLRNLT